MMEQGTTKALIRRKILQKRNELDTKSWVQSSKLIYSKLLAHELIKQSESIGIYVSNGKEISTNELILELLKTNKCISVPKIVNDDLEFREIKTFEDLEMGKYGILEPIQECLVVSPKEINLLIVPCVAVDCNGNRVGMGKGYFDRFLSSNNSMKTICLAYEIQFLPEINPEEHDQKIDYIITEEKFMKVCKNG